MSFPEQAPRDVPEPGRSLRLHGIRAGIRSLRLRSVGQSIVGLQQGSWIAEDESARVDVEHFHGEIMVRYDLPDPDGYGYGINHTIGTDPKGRDTDGIRESRDAYGRQKGDAVQLSVGQVKRTMERAHDLIRTGQKIA